MVDVIFRHFSTFQLGLDNFSIILLIILVHGAVVVTGRLILFCAGCEGSANCTGCDKPD